MRCSSTVVTAAIVFLLLPVAGAAGIDGEEDGPILELAPGTGNDFDRPPPLPDPVPSPTEPLATPYDEYQLVGFTGQTFAGNRGVLNLSRACGGDYPGSRICQAQEILHTVTVPEVPDPLLGERAWILTSGPESEALGVAASVTNCLGWSSDSAREYGLAIELGLRRGCYGAFLSTGCDRDLVVACCARVAR